MIPRKRVYLFCVLATVLIIFLGSIGLEAIVDGPLVVGTATLWGAVGAFINGCNMILSRYKDSDGMLEINRKSVPGLLVLLLAMIAGFYIDPGFVSGGGAFGLMGGAALNFSLAVVAVGIVAPQSKDPAVFRIYRLK